MSTASVSSRSWSRRSTFLSSSRTIWRREDGLPPSGYFGKGAQAFFEELLDSVDRNAGGLENREHRSVFLLQEGLEDVLGADFGVARALRGFLRCGESFLALGGQAVESHRRPRTRGVRRYTPARQ